MILATKVGKTKVKTNIPVVESLTCHMEYLEVAKSMLRQAQQKQEEQANKSRREDHFDLEDKVLLSSAHLNIAENGSRKLGPKFIRPFEVLERIGKPAYKIKLPPH